MNNIQPIITFPEPLLQGIFLKRYKRFFADVLLDGQVVTAHVPNTGSLKTCLFPDTPCYLSPAKDPERKLKYTLEMTSSPQGTWIGVNTQWPNKFVFELWKNKILPHWLDYDLCKPEFKITPETRFDFQLSQSQGGRCLYVEVKNVTYLSADSGQAQFPDAVTERGQKHLKELMRLKKEGHDSEIVYIIQRSDAVSFGPCDEIDPEYGHLFREALECGVRVTPLLIEVSPQGLFYQYK
ncbi:MAG TPA: DNA/RNA nuclease SfsA [Pseudobdellovibrionaceae bacterium]|nr:DNA/RNA nuclease SfsA [Pseudobdellovibrionaceae bacterium]